jgi:GMP synthase (glutamine-hydrolysing)
MPISAQKSPARIRVIEGNTAEGRAEQLAAGGGFPSRGYAELMCGLLPGAEIDICHAADAGAALPRGAALEGYDGAVFTGSALHIYQGGPAVTQQIELARGLFAAGTPAFGSCWGLQVLTVAAGGSVRRNPKGRELGFGRGIRLTEAGRKHPMYIGKPDVFNAPTVHLDEVETAAPGSVVLATNAVSEVQSAEIHCNGTVAWGVQYHPEYPLREIAAIVRRIGKRLIEEGFFLDEGDIKNFSGDLDALDQNPADKRLAWRHGISNNVLDTRLRVSEVANWIEYHVLPKRAKRGRG